MTTLSDTRRRSDNARTNASHIVPLDLRSLSPLSMVWIASAAAGASNRVLSQRLGLPVAVMLMPALILLIPRSLGHTGKGQIMLSENLPRIIRRITTMKQTAVSIVAVLLFTDIIAPTGLSVSNRSTVFSRSEQ